MKGLSAGLIFVTLSTVAALLLGMAESGIPKSGAIISVFIGAAFAFVAYFQTYDLVPVEASVSEPLPPEQNKRRKKKTTPAVEEATVNPVTNYRSTILYLLVTIFAIFAVRSFCWLLYIDGGDYKIQSPNNLGDISLHIAHIREFANGVPLWPDNPIYYGSKLRYPAGADFFNGILIRLGIGLIPGLVWTGLLACAATCFAFYRWGGAFGIAGFLFNGGIAGWKYFSTFQFSDYQGGNTIAWKSIALSMFVTQRGFLYAIPAGLLLLCSWRAKYFANQESYPTAKKMCLPFWIELSLYAAMPLFHLHTFLVLTLVLGVFFLLGDQLVRKQTALLLISAFLPATFFVWLVTDHFHAGSILAWKVGWVQTGQNDFAMPFLQFWFWNFGAWIPLVLCFLYLCGHRIWKNFEKPNERLSTATAFAIPALLLFLLTCLVKLAPWEWDNMKVIIWAYFLLLPFLWSEVIVRWPVVIRIVVCIALFTSGFVSLFGGLAVGEKGFGLATRAEVDDVGAVVKKIGPNERFASYPTYNHPLLLQGRKVVLGYPGHLWTQGFAYQEDERKLNQLMNGEPGWQKIAGDFQARYLFWGPDEKSHYSSSTRPWEKEATLVASGSWGSIYDLKSAINSYFRQ